MVLCEESLAHIPWVKAHCSDGFGIAASIRKSENYADPIPKIPKPPEKGNAPNLAHDTRFPETKSVSNMPGCTELHTKMSRDNSFA